MIDVLKDAKFLASIGLLFGASLIGKANIEHSFTHPPVFLGKNAIMTLYGSCGYNVDTPDELVGFRGSGKSSDPISETTAHVIPSGAFPRGNLIESGENQTAIPGFTEIYTASIYKDANGEDHEFEKLSGILICPQQVVDGLVSGVPSIPNRIASGFSAIAIS